MTVSASNNWKMNWMVNSIFRLTTRRKTIQRISGPLWVWSTGGFPHSSTNNAEIGFNFFTSLWFMSSLIILFTLWFRFHDNIIIWKHFPRRWSFVRGIHRSPVNSPHKGQWRGALMFSLICVWINGWVNNVEGGDLRRHRSHYDVTVMKQ